MSVSWQQVVEKTVTGLGYELVDCERSSRGLLVVYIDRLPGGNYLTGPGNVVMVEDCETVTRQLQHVLEVEGCEYERLEVSSPGLDRPLRRAADYDRFIGEQIEITLKASFEGRKKFRGVLRRPEAAALQTQYELVFKDGKVDQVLGFALEEVQEARLMPVLDFKGRKSRTEPSGEDETDITAAGRGAQESGGHKE
ncbi:MAG: ribosome maturation factor RimP [Burkholderiales bacterium]